MEHCSCGKVMEKGIRYLKGKLVCKMCWYQSKPIKSSTYDAEKVYSKWNEN